MTILPIVVLLITGNAGEPETSRASEFQQEGSPWKGQIGDGFAKYARAVELKLSRAFGTTDSGSNQSHNLALMQLTGGFMLTDVLAPNYWFGGNLEGTAQFLAGGQDSPEAAYFFGLNGGLRYHFRTGTRLDPFLAGSFGVAITDIEHPDLSGKFQFNEQIGAGVRYFLGKRHALNFEYALWHVSNGGTREPNDGVNAHIATIGFSWLF